MAEEREKVVVDKTEINNKRTGLSVGMIVLIVIVVLFILFLLFGGANMFGGGTGVAGEPAVNTIPIPNPGQ